ncbi:MAG: transcription antitermination factor NusB [Deltaproteobacteria bacterium CG11_big_fil_rev_8_21_14_0_20_49_13]|nr:MAG: transcription antitermination factor NusB [Deltaproteobacteria bacterium CG11_big_fil_rev_8_21_14_0_20_49_13]
MGDRRKAREFALQMMYAVDLSKASAGDALLYFWSAQENVVEESRSFAELLLKGTAEKLAEIDKKISDCSSNWKIGRMSVVDRNVLRLSIYELLFCPDIPVRVTLNEAIEIAKLYGTEESGSFVNGILDKIAKGVDKE